MPKLYGPDFISLQVRDLAKSKEFYTELLGMTVDPELDNANFVLFDSISIPIGLSQTTTDQAQIPVQPGWGIALWLDCDEVDELWSKLNAAGVTIVKPPADGPFGRMFVFTDPDGYIITANKNQWERFPLGGKHLY